MILLAVGAGRLARPTAFRAGHFLDDVVDIVDLYGFAAVATLAGHTALSTTMLAMLFRALFRLSHPMAPLYRSMWMAMSATPD